jgi:hypothetical protein
MRTRSLSLSIVLLAAACGGGGGNPDAAPHPDSHPTIDAPPNPDAPQTADASTIDAVSTIDGAVADAVSTVDGAIGDAVVTPDGGTASDGGTATDGGTTACLADPAGYGTATVTNQTEYDTGDTTYYQVMGDLNADVDQLWLLLYGGYGVFGTNPGVDPVTVGTFDIANDVFTYATCGACLFVMANNTTDLADPNGVYLASAGTLTITSLSPNVTGSVDNLVLQHVTIDGTTLDTTAVGDCTTTITHADFDVPATVPALAGGPIGLHLRHIVHHH